MKETQSRWSSQTKLVTIISLLLLGVYLFSRFAVVVAPLVMALILAYILSPLANWIEARFRIPRGLATLLAYLVLLSAISAMLMVVIPPLARQLRGLNVDLQRSLMQIESLIGNQYIIAGQEINLEALYERAVGSLQGLLEPVFGQTLGFAFEVVTSLVWVVFIFVVSFYLIKDAQALKAWIEKLVPPAYFDDYVRLRDLIGDIWSAFFRGQLILALIVATIFTTTGFILGLPFALAMGVLAGLLEFLPSLGHLIWLTLASLLAFFVGSTWLPLPNWVFMLVVIGLHLVFQQFDLNYLIPRIIGRSVHLPPLVVILGIVAGAVFAGVLGILLAAPTIASARVLGHYIYANLFDLEPFPEVAGSSLPPPDPYWWRKIPVQKPGRTSQDE